MGNMFRVTYYQQYILTYYPEIVKEMCGIKDVHMTDIRTRDTHGRYTQEI